MNWIKFWPIYLLISGIALSLSVYSVLFWGFKLSIDFTGGSVVEYKFSSPQEANLVEILVSLKQKEHKQSLSLRDEVKSVTQISKDSVELRFGPEFLQEDAQVLSLSLAEALNEKPELVRFESVGPILSKEILEKTYTAVAIAAVGILLWVALQFKSIKFGVAAILAMLHDTLILLGTFAILGHYKGIEVDILFVTAMLTTLSFSVHDTIVVFDRVREATRRFGSMPIALLANKAVSETMVRSLNNSLTIIFMLFALFLMGGESIKWFAFALLVGTIAGTYSSPFVAVPLLVLWDKLAVWLKKRKK